MMNFRRQASHPGLPAAEEDLERDRLVAHPGAVGRTKIRHPAFGRDARPREAGHHGSVSHEVLEFGDPVGEVRVHGVLNDPKEAGFG